MRIVANGLACAFFAVAAPAWAASTECSLPGGVANGDMAAILAADQADRRDEVHMDFAVVVPRDKQRREATRKLLDGGRLTTGADYCAAALVFQHGQSSSDYLLAHVLATIAAAKGDQRALWLSSATLDRFLMTTGRKQVFGTQFTLPGGPTSPWSQEPYDRDLISDKLRSQLGVPDQKAQSLRLQGLEADRQSRAKAATDR